MTFTAADLIIAWLLDSAIGDPAWLPWPHPVVGVGRLIASLEPRLRRGDQLGPRALVWRGAALWICVVGATVLAGWVLLTAAAAVHPWLGHATIIYLAYSCLATRNLSDEANAIARALHRDRLEQARERLARIVGRDTRDLDSVAVARAGIESVAENSSDGVVAPLFFLAVGGALGWGPLLGLAYKAVNTLDSMVGYRNPRYEHLGKVSARLDDIFNWLPARLSALLAAASAHLTGGAGTTTLRVAWRDGAKHKSPNSGYPEAAFAAALGVQLGGGASYGGVLRPAPRLGDPGENPGARQLDDAADLLWWMSALGGMLAAGLLVIF